MTFPLALTFLTICPWPRLPLAGPQELARSMFWFPWVGVLLGGLYWGAWAGLARVLPLPGAAGVLLAFTVLSTGAPEATGM